MARNLPKENDANDDRDDRRLKFREWHKPQT